MTDDPAALEPKRPRPAACRPGSAAPDRFPFKRRLSAAANTPLPARKVVPADLGATGSAADGWSSGPGVADLEQRGCWRLWPVAG